MSMHREEEMYRRMIKKTISMRSLLLSVFLLLMIFPLTIAVITYNKENEVSQKQVSQYLLQTVEQTQRALDANLAEVDRLTWPLLYQQSLDFLDYPLETPYQLFQANQKFRPVSGRLESSVASGNRSSLCGSCECSGDSSGSGSSGDSTECGAANIHLIRDYEQTG
nr:hypothetical protein [Paenibacillus marchantiophytorum]